PGGGGGAQRPAGAVDARARVIAGARRARALGGAALDLLSGVVALVWLLPLVTMLLTALKPDPEIYAAVFTWLPSRPTLAHFAKAWAAAPFGRYYLNSLVVAGSATLMTMAIGSLAAFALCRLRLPGRMLLLGGIIGTTMVPFQVLLIPFFIL